MSLSRTRRTYGDKLKDPRWQKRRLEIFKRDEWTCQQCGDTETTPLSPFSQTGCPETVVPSSP
jgi:5-methylcytosine-specific restriction endonuclease McrA